MLSLATLHRRPSKLDAGNGGACRLVRQRPELYFFRLRAYEEIAGTSFSGVVQ